MQLSPFLGELVGTMILILLGDGVVANVVLKKTKGEASGWIVITTGWAFAVATGDYSKIASYIPAQLIGAFLGAVLVWLQYLPHWAATPDSGAKLAVFATGPAIRHPLGNVISETIGTLALIIGIAGISAKALGTIAIGLGPYLVGVLVWSIGLSLGGTTGYAINPARDLGPRLAHALLPVPGKGSSDWGYAWVPVVGPILGAILGGLLIRWYAL